MTLPVDSGDAPRPAVKQVKPGYKCGSLEVVGQAAERNAQGRPAWLCRCTRKLRDGTVCGRELLVRETHLKSAWVKTCGHHRRGNFTRLHKEHGKTPRRVEWKGEWYVLPSEAAKIIRVKRVRRDRFPAIVPQLIPKGLRGQLVEYLPEKAVYAEADKRRKLEEPPEEESDVGLEDFAEKIGRTPNHVRFTALKVFGEKLTVKQARGKPDAKCKRGRLRTKAFVPAALQAKLRAYFAAAPERQARGLAGAEVEPFVAPTAPPVAPPVVKERSEAATAATKQPVKPDKPRWDDMTATLYWGERVVRAFRRHPAQNQRELIRAFAKENWAVTIPDPFNDARKLALTIYDLNRAIEPHTIRFGGDGEALGPRWYPAE